MFYYVVQFLFRQVFYVACVIFTAAWTVKNNVSVKNHGRIKFPEKSVNYIFCIAAFAEPFSNGRHGLKCVFNLQEKFFFLFFPFLWSPSFFFVSNKAAAPLSADSRMLMADSCNGFPFSWRKNHAPAAAQHSTIMPTTTLRKEREDAIKRNSITFRKSTRGKIANLHFQYFSVFFLLCEVCILHCTQQNK